MKELSLLFSIQLRRVKNIFYPLRKSFLFKVSLLVIFIFLFEYGIYKFFNKIFLYLLSEDTFNEFFVVYLVERLMGMVFIMVFTMLIFSSILSSLSVIYLSKDLPILISAPMRLDRIFLSKYINSIIVSSYTVVLIMIPIFLSYADCFNTHNTFIFQSLFVLILFIIFSCGLGSLVTIILMRFFPAKRTHQVLTVLSLAMLITLISIVRMMRPERLLRPEGGTDFASVLESITVSAVSYFPGTWASKAVLGAGQQNSQIFMSGFIPLLLSAFLITFITYLIARKIYFKSWSMGGVSRRGGSTKRNIRFMNMLDSIFKFLPPRYRTLIMKDTVLFFRDTTQWSQLMILAGLVFIYLLNIKSLPLTSAMLSNLPARGVLSYLNIAFMGFIIATVVARFGYPAVSFEAKSVWVIRSMPINFRQYLWTKFLMFFLPLLILVLLLTYASNLLLEIPRIPSIGTLFVMTLITFGLTGLGVGLGAAYPKFRYENAAQIITGIGGLFFMIISLVYVGVIVILMAVPGYQYFAYITTGRIMPPLPSILAILAVVGISISIAIIPMEFGLKKWRKYEI